MSNSKDNKRKIITFCGSARLYEWFHFLATAYTVIPGWIVLMPHCYYEDGSRPDFKDLLMDIHRDMIEMSDAILVINKDGYIGESTKELIELAESLNKEIEYFEVPDGSPPDGIDMDKRYLSKLNNKGEIGYGRE